MSCLVWNCRGLNSPAAVRSLKDVLVCNRPSVVGLIETKVSCRVWDVLRVKLGFRNCFAVDRLGLSGGLALLWGEDAVIQVRSFSKFHIDVTIEEPSRFRFTIFYGNPNRSLRGNSWNLLSTLAEQEDGAWLVGGDFNEVFYSREVLSKGCRELNQMRKFREVVDTCGLIDLGFRGYPYTFSNKRKFPDEYKARLDRFIANDKWRDKFRDAEVRHLIASRSDHCLIQVLWERCKSQKRSKAFRFEAMWYRDQHFKEHLERCWEEANGESNSSRQVLKVVAKKLSTWNAKNFGHVKQRISKLKHRLEALKETDRSSQIIDEEQRIQRDLDEWWAREELLWKQRSRVQWLKEWDRNTNFFHASASQRRKTNYIERLRNDSGEWVQGEDQLMSVVMGYFTNIFNSQIRTNPEHWHTLMGIIDRKVTEEENAELLRGISDQEIQSATFQLGPLKAPGVDGFPALFFQKHWNQVKVFVMRSVRSFLEHGSLDREVNETIICLIPKTKTQRECKTFDQSVSAQS